MLVVGSCQTSRLWESYVLLGASQTGPGAPKQTRPISTWFYPDTFSSRLKRVFSLHTRLLDPGTAGSHLTRVLGSPGPRGTVSSPWLLGELLLDSPRHLLLHSF